jgi:hypothetical protein
MAKPKEKKKTLQSVLSKDEGEKFEKRLRDLSEQQNIKYTESAYIRKLILDDIKKGNDP